MITQLAAMALIIALGWYMGYKKTIGEQTTAELSNFLMRYVVPVVMVLTLDRPYVHEEAMRMLAAAVITIGAKLLMIAGTKLLFKKEQTAERYAIIFYNAVFMGIPLIQGLFGTEALIYIVPTIIISNILTWTYGVRMLSGTKAPLQWKDLRKNPAIIGGVVGMVFFLTPLELPPFVRYAAELVSGLNTPLGMFLIGIFLAREPITRVLQNRAALKVALVPVLLVPVLLALLLLPLPLSSDLKLIQMIMHATPAAVNLAIFSELLGKDANYGAQLVSVSTLLMVVTMPLIQLLGSRLFL